MHRYSSIDRTDIDRDAPILIGPVDRSIATATAGTRGAPGAPDVDGVCGFDVDLNRAREDDAWPNARAVDADARTRG